MSILRGRLFSNFGTNLFLCTLLFSFRNLVKIAIFHPWDLKKTNNNPPVLGGVFDGILRPRNNKNANNNNNNKVRIFGSFCWTFFLSDLFLGFIWNDICLVFLLLTSPPRKVGRVSGHLRCPSERFRLGWRRQGAAVWSGFFSPKKHGWFFFPWENVIQIIYSFLRMGKFFTHFFGWMGENTLPFFFGRMVVFIFHWRVSFSGRHDMVVIRKISFISSDLSGKTSIHWLLLSGNCPWVSCWMGIVSLDVGYCDGYTYHGT